MPTTPFENDPLDAVEVKSSCASASSRKTLAFKPRRSIAEQNLEGALLSAALAADEELGRVLRDLDAISSSLKSGEPEAEVFRIAIRPAVRYAVKHALLERELRQLALCDDLTRLYNRRGFVAAATQQLKMARRNRKPALLLFCDLDGLKAINDSFGHHDGDLALVHAADALKDVFRESDILARVSGDEFAVLAIDLPPRHRKTILTRLHKSLNKLSSDETRYELSLSVGAAWFDPQHPISLGELMEQGDRAMYERKRGRIHVVTKEPPVFRNAAGSAKLCCPKLLKKKA